MKIKDLNEKRGAKLKEARTLIDKAVAEKRELFQADGIHPTAEAQERLLANVWKALGPMLGKAQQKPRKE